MVISDTHDNNFICLKSILKSKMSSRARKGWEIEILYWYCTFLCVTLQWWSIFHPAPEPRTRERRHIACVCCHWTQDSGPLITTCCTDQRHWGSGVCKLLPLTAQTGYLSDSNQGCNDHTGITLMLPPSSLLLLKYASIFCLFFINCCTNSNKSLIWSPSVMVRGSKSHKLCLKWRNCGCSQSVFLDQFNLHY